MAKFLSDEQIASIVLQDYNWASNYRLQFRKKWDRFYVLYKNYMDKAKYHLNTMTKIAIPSAYNIVETQTAFLLNQIFEAGSFVEVLGKNPNAQFSASAVKENLNYHFRHSIRTFEEMEKFIRQLLIYGTSVFKVYWNYQTGWKTDYIMEPSYDGQEPKSKPVVSRQELFNQPGGYTTDIYNFGIDPHATGCTDARFAFEDMYVDPMVVIEKGKSNKWRNIEEALTYTSNYDEAGIRMRLGLTDVNAHTQPMYAERNQLHLVDYWGFLTKGWKDGSLSKEAKNQLYHVIMAISGGGYSSKGTVLYADPSPYNHDTVPYIDTGLNRCVGEFYGQGDIEYCESLFQEERDFRNIQLDNLTGILMPMWLVSRTAQINTNELKRKPNGVVHVDDIDRDVRELQMRPIDASSFQAQVETRKDIETTTGVNDFVMGQFRSSTGFNDTATGISLIQNMALQRINHKGQCVQRGIRDIALMIHKLCVQYQTWVKTVRILDRDNALKYRFIDVSPETLRNEYDFNIVSAPSVGSKAMRQQQLLQIYQILTDVQARGGQAPDLDRFARRMLLEMDVPNPEEFYGFPNFNRPLPPSLGEPSAMDELIAPEEENRLMIEQRQYVVPKIEENHQMHMLAHSEAYDATRDSQAKMLLTRHYDEHLKLSQAARELIATAGATQMAAQQMEQAQMAQQQQPQSGFAGGGGGRRKMSLASSGGNTGAGGQEDAMRVLGNVMAGNAG